MSIKRINIEDLPRLKAFCHATITGDYIHVSGTLGTEVNEMKIVEGGTAAETTRIIENFEKILAGCGATIFDLVKVNVYITKMEKFGEMNQAYIAKFGEKAPARITVGCRELALGATVEMDGVAYKKAE